MNDFYTYAFLRTNRTPYYIGKGRGNRAWNGRAQGHRRPPKDSSRILLLKKGLTEEQAFKHEKYMIAVLGRKDLGVGILRNGTDGGEGCSGMIHSAETRAKMSRVKRGSNHHMFGKKQSAEVRAKMAEGQRKRHNAETRAKQVKVMSGENNPRAKTFIFTNPKGEEFVVIGRSAAFCREQGLSVKSMQKSLKRSFCPPHRSGWQVRHAK